ncbi:ketopantoate reductase family protein [Virgibacillus salexigens]|uniref:ketopantoate reductase family protein n=1 Tax=Virgibacillus massiliensis TaxID=1462526 RepID=UPI001370A1B1|nr:2-dehydropantoate 2-reductase [Virgibacillus massiliensis]MYL43237.1 2-dehydropantoate 2-reductase [Virgibacillus massiliensis]
MHVVILGAGALGGYFGLRYQEAGAKVTFLVRERRAEQIQKHGLAIRSPQGDYNVKDPILCTDPNNIEKPDIVIVSVKGYHLAGTLDSLQVLVQKGAYILPVLNGIEHMDILQEKLGEKNIIGGLSFIIATLNEQGYVVHSSDFHELVFGPLNSSQEEVCKRLEELSSKAVMTATYHPSILYEQWKKYMFISAFSGITTAINLPIGPIREHKETFAIAVNLLQEMKKLANACQIKVTDDDVEMAKEKLLGLNNEATSSMHQDRRKQSPLELDHLHGAAIRLAKQKGLTLPYTNMVLGMVKPFANLT